MQQLRKIPAFDGFRGIGVAIVVLAHLPMVNGATLYNAVWQANQTTRVGYICLDIFFTISGFLITRLLLAERYGIGRISFRTFYERRALRIFPVYFIAVFVCFLLFPMTVGEKLSLLTYTFNIYHPLTALSNPLEHTWSLSVEEQFYFAWPFLIAFIPMRLLPLLTGRLLPAVAVASGLAISWFVVSEDKALTGNLVYMLPLTRMLSLSFGGWLAVREFENKPVRGWICLDLFVSATVGLLADFYLKRIGFVASQGLYWTIALICYAMISVAVAATLVFDESRLARALSRFLELAPLRFLGQLSYALYVFHLPVLYYFGINDAALAQRTASAFTVTAVVAIVLTLALLSQRFVEAPLMALRNRKPGPVALTAK